MAPRKSKEKKVAVPALDSSDIDARQALSSPENPRGPSTITKGPSRFAESIKRRPGRPPKKRRVLASDWEDKLAKQPTPPSDESPSPFTHSEDNKQEDEAFNLQANFRYFSGAHKPSPVPPSNQFGDSSSPSKTAQARKAILKKSEKAPPWHLVTDSQPLVDIPKWFDCQVGYFHFQLQSYHPS